MLPEKLLNRGILPLEEEVAPQRLLAPNFPLPAYALNLEEDKKDDSLDLARRRVSDLDIAEESVGSIDQRFGVQHDPIRPQTMKDKKIKAARGNPVLLEGVSSIESDSSVSGEGSHTSPSFNKVWFSFIVKSQMEKELGQ